MDKFFDLHRHDERSSFDGFGKSNELATIAVDLEYPALGISNHGDMSSLVTHYFACKEAGVKPILGNEVYFQPSFKKIRNSFHLCLFVKNVKGYKNLNKMVTKANKDQYYYKSIIDFDLLEKYSDGLICTTACIGGVASKFLADGKDDLAMKVLKRFKKIFEDDLYIEIQPFVLSVEGLQENVNCKLVEIARELDIKCIFTSDSHYGKKEDFNTYLKMHEIGGHLEIGKHYTERYMPTEKQIVKRFRKMHGNEESKYYVSSPKRFARECLDNLTDIKDKVDDEILEKLKLVLPTFDDEGDSKKLLWDNIVKGLKAKNIYNKEYVARCKEEYEVITFHGFEDYFLIVQDYTLWAKKRGIRVGPGRGSVCNSLLAYSLGITDVDSIYFDLDFKRFLRKDKKKLPDIDLDFETDRRVEVIDYLLEKYKGHAARICSYGLYKEHNLLNDLYKVCDLSLADKNDEYKSTKDEMIIQVQKEIKSGVNKYIDPESGGFNLEEALKNPVLNEYNNQYDNILVHFSKLYRKVRFYGTHAAGVAISGGNILDYTAIERRASEQYTTSYDLNDIELINAIKFDMLGLRTMSVLGELRDITKTPDAFNYDWLTDEKIINNFGLGKTNGIFQFEGKGAQNVLREIEADCWQDVIAASALNRPGPLSLGMVKQYAENKNAAHSHKKVVKAENNIFFEYAKDTYGTFVYQEQIMKVCRELGGMSWGDTDKVIKFLKGVQMTARAMEEQRREESRLIALFVEGAMEHGLSKHEAEEVFRKILVYAFNKGHATGYTLISIEQMYYKVYFPNEFWYVTLKFASDKDYFRLSSKAAQDGAVLLLPHVNGGALHQLSTVDGEKCIWEGMSNHKGIGEKAAAFIQQEKEDNGPFKSRDDFMDRIEPYRRVVNKRVLEILNEQGALEFDEKIFYGRCVKYNSTLQSRG